MPFRPCPSLVTALLARAALCGMLALPPYAAAAALGEATVRSALGQRLEADIDLASLTAAESESLAVRLAPANAFAEAGLDYPALLRSLRFSIERRGDRSVVHVSSELPVNEPFLTLLVELNANGTRMIRQYALLLDPPAVQTPSDTAAIVPPQPAPAPVPAEPAATAAQPSADQSPAAVTAKAATSSPSSRVVRRGETLRSIAATVQPQDVRLEQVLVALQNANPDAFVDRNVHRLKSGSVLTVPDADAMRAVDPGAARRVLRVQTADFIRYQRRLAERAAAVTAPASATANSPDTGADAGNRSSSGKVGVQVAEPKTAPTAQDRLTLAAPGKGEAAGTAANGSDALDKIASEKALAEANARIAALEKNIGQMQDLLKLQNQRLAEAQQRAQAQPVPEPKKEAAQAQPAPKAKETAKAPATQPAKPAAPARAASNEREAATLLDDPRVIGGAAGALLLPLLAWVALRARRRHGGKQPVERREPEVVPTLMVEADGEPRGQSELRPDAPPASMLDTPGVDAVAEADVYIAYGRDEQAEEILVDALRAHPERNALRLKLLEIYAARKDVPKFGVLASELRLRTGGQGADWEQAARLGQMLDPGNPLYRSPSGVAPAAQAKAADYRPAKGDSPVADFELKLEGLLDEQRKEKATPSRPAADADNTIEFQLAGIRSEPPAANDQALNTKLELALACQEIGDKEGARELLTEVATARDPALAQRAQSLLKQLA